MQLLSYLTSNHTFVIYLIYISLYSVNRIDNLIRYKKKKEQIHFPLWSSRLPAAKIHSLYTLILPSHITGFRILSQAQVVAAYEVRSLIILLSSGKKQIC